MTANRSTTTPSSPSADSAAMVQSVIPLAARRHGIVTAVERALSSRIDLPHNEKLLVGVSGGADSLALLIALSIIARRRNAADRLTAEPLACHVHHHLRPSEQADADAEHVRAVCEKLRIRFELRHIHPAQSPGNVEASARRQRYQALADVAAANGTRFIATAHHADDQLETMLMALCRGCGPDGLAGMRWVRPLMDSPQSRAGDPAAPQLLLVRPLLDVERSECESLCKAAQISWRDDASNADLSRARARMRADVVPVLAALWPGVAGRMSSTSDLLRLCANLLDDHLASQFGPATLRTWPRDDLRCMPHALLAAGLRRAALALDPQIADQLGSTHLTAAGELIRSDEIHRKQFDWPGGLLLEVTSQWVAITQGSAGQGGGGAATTERTHAP